MYHTHRYKILNDPLKVASQKQVRKKITVFEEQDEHNR